MHSSGKLERAGVFVLVRFLKKKKSYPTEQKGRCIYAKGTTRADTKVPRCLACYSPTNNPPTNRKTQQVLWRQKQDMRYKEVSMGSARQPEKRPHVPTLRRWHFILLTKVNMWGRRQFRRVCRGTATWARPPTVCGWNSDSQGGQCQWVWRRGSGPTSQPYWDPPLHRAAFQDSASLEEPTELNSWLLPEVLGLKELTLASSNLVCAAVPTLSATSRTGAWGRAVTWIQQQRARNRLCLQPKRKKSVFGKERINLNF